MFIAICDDDILYMNKVKEMIEQWGKDNNEDVSVYLFNHGDALINSYQNRCYFFRYHDASIKRYGCSS